MQKTMGIKKPEFGDLRRFNTQAYICTKTAHNPLYGAVWMEIKHIRAGVRLSFSYTKEKTGTRLLGAAPIFFNRRGKIRPRGLGAPPDPPIKATLNSRLKIVIT